MDCRSVKKLLNDFLEGTLSEGVREKINLHLGACSHCQKEKELLSKTWQILDAYTTPELKEDFTESLMKKIHLEQAEIIKVRYRLPQFSFRPLAPVLASLATIVLVFSLLINKIPVSSVSREIKKPAASLTVSQENLFTVSEQEIIQDLDILQNLELLENLNLLNDFDIVEEAEDLGAAT